MERRRSANRRKRERKRKKRDESTNLIIPSHLPDEIIDEILSRLPVKSLLRFRCVCKRWLSTISNPNFFKRESVSLFLMVSDHETNPCYTIDDGEEAVANAFSMPWGNGNRYSTKDYVVVSNSCNGLLLIGFNESLFLFNPSTRSFVKVLTLDLLKGIGYGITVGLCYETYVNDYKAIVSRSHDTHCGDEFVLVASLKRKEWTEISFPSDVCSTMEGPVVNGLLHWTVCENSMEDGFWPVSDSTDDEFSADRKIIRFDPRTNRFHDFPSPQSEFGDENAIVGLGVLGGCLCMARADNPNDIEILTMKEYGVVESWTSMFVLSNMWVNSHSGYLTPFLVPKDGEVLLMMSSNPTDVIAYNPRTNSHGRIFEIPSYGNMVQAASLVESLVSPIDYRWDPIRHKKLGRKIKWEKSYPRRCCIFF